MKVGLFNTVRGGTERFQPFIEEGMDLELVGFNCPPSLTALEELKKAGCEAMIYTSDHKEDEQFFQKIAECGVKYVCCCCAGYDHLDLPAMKKYGLRAANVPSYSPNAVSEHTVMLVLACLRNLRRQILQVDSGCYLQKGLRGREIRNMEIGIVGAGRIGLTTMRCLSGFGPKRMYAYDPYPNDRVRAYAAYVSLAELYARSDIIIFHNSYHEESHHMVNRESLARMKDGVVLINCARGGLFDAQAVLEGVESGKIGAVGLDVLEGEGVLRKQPLYRECPLPVLRSLLSHENVVFTPHTAFFTDEADRNLSEGTVANLNQYRLTGSCDRELIGE